MRGSSTLPIWSYPLVLGLIGIVLYIGKLSPALQTGVGVESIFFLGYLFFRARRPAQAPRAVANLLPLFPGHLLLLLAVLLLPTPAPLLVVLWMLIPIATIFYDVVAAWQVLKKRARMSISAGLYCIIWADLFFLLERVIVLGRKVSGNAEIIVAAVFGVVGTAFIFVGVYRHWYASEH